MHLYVRKQPGDHKSGGPNWGLIWEWHDKGKVSQKRVPKNEYEGLGVPLTLTLKEAKTRVAQLNAQETLKTRERSKIAIKKRLDDEKLIVTAFLTSEDVEEFESTVLLARMNPEQAKAKKLLSHWRACKKAIRIVSLDVSEWCVTPHKFYDFWIEEKLSMSYIKKLIPLMNKWGLYQSRKYKKYFEPLPFPTGEESTKISESYLDEFDRLNDSDPITASQLESNRSKLSEESYNWLLISVWFGLRPKEIDSLKKPQSDTSWSIGTNKNGVELLYVYQSKLTKLARNKRVKHIPCFAKEQIEILKIIKSGNFKRPLVKTLKKIFTPYTNCYGGRKGFSNFMLSHGHKFDIVSKWLGHQNIDMTYKVYLDHQNVDEYKKVS